MGVVSEAATTVVEKALGNKPLRIKILTKKPVISSCGFKKQVSMMNSMEKSASTGKESTNNGFGNRKLESSIVGTKRKLGGGVVCERVMRLKMDRYATSNCKVILGKLLKHRFGFPFKKPVDPVELRIPDYFDIIKKPMDLGTIRQKLDGDKYRDADEFESDVRLTFSNAILYNPPDNCVHHYAKELMTFFEHLWKPVKVKMNRQVEGVRQLSSQKTVGEAISDADKKCLKSFSSHAVKLPGDTVLPNEINPEELRDISVKKKVRLNRQCEYLKQLSSQKLEETTLDENQKILKRCSSHVGKLPGKTMLLNGKDREELTEVSIKEEKVNRHCGSMEPLKSTFSHVDKLPAQPILTNVKHPQEPMEASIERRVHMRSMKDVKEVKAKSFMSSRICRSDTRSGDENSEFLCARPVVSVVKVKYENAKESRQGRKAPHNEIKSVEVKKLSTPQLSKSDQDSCLDEKRASRTSVATASGYSSIEGLGTGFDIPVSPSKALRAAMLKSRFADTIWKAQHNTLLQSGGGTDYVKLQQEKERLERKQREEKAKIEAQIRAAERAAGVKAESELKRRREQERMALEKMEQSVDLDDNFHVLRELEGLIGKPLFVICKCRNGRSDAAYLWDKIEAEELRSPLEQLGLFMKAEHLGEDDYDDDDGAESLQREREEGEVVF